MDSFIAWGQAYGLWITIAFLAFICITSSIENSRLKKSIEVLRSENSLLNKGLHRAYTRGGGQSFTDGESK